MESLIDEFYPLPKDRAGNFDEYSGDMWLIRSGTMFGLAFLMLLINLRKEFHALRYISVLILVAILATIVVSI